MYLGLSAVLGEIVVHFFLGDKSVLYYEAQHDYAHCKNHPASLRRASELKMAREARQVADADLDAAAETAVAAPDTAV